jgi:hypothetical protein
MNLGLFFVALETIQRVMAAQSEDGATDAGHLDGKHAVAPCSPERLPRCREVSVLGRLGGQHRSSVL